MSQQNDLSKKGTGGEVPPPLSGWRAMVNWSSVRFPNLAAKHAVVLTIAIFFVSTIFGAFFAWRLSETIFHDMALSGTTILADALEEVRTFYTTAVVEKVAPHGIDATHEYKTKEKTIPLPVNFTLEIGQGVGTHGSGVVASLYSSFPFPWRRDRILDAFQKEAIAKFQREPNSEFYRFEKVNGKQSIRYTRPDLMRASCIRCHNTHPESPKKDWKVGDVRGVLEVMRPIEVVAEKSQEAFIRFLIVVGTISLLGGSTVALSILSIRRTSLALAKSTEDLKHSEMETRTALERQTYYSNLLDQAVKVTGLGIFDHDHVTDVVEHSASAKEILGWTSDKPLDYQSIIEHFHPEDRSRVGDKIRCAHDPSGDGVFDSEHRILRSDGSVRWVRVKAQTFFGGEGTKRVPVRTVGSILDITDTKEREVALADSRNYIDGIVKISPVILSIWDLDLQKTLFVSPQVMTFLGYAEEEVRRFDSIVQKLGHPDDVGSLVAHQSQIRRMNFGESAEVTFRCRHKDGGWRYLLTRSAPFKRNDRGVISQMLSATIDITRLKRLQEQLERSNQELEQFASIAAHDLRSPIASMHSWVDMLSLVAPQQRSEQFDQAVAFIRQNTEKAEALIRDVLDFARLNVSSAQLERVDLNKVAADLFAELKEEIQVANAHIRCDALPTLMGNASHLASLFGNLVRNALTYRDKTRTLEISVGCREVQDCYEFSVRDNGVGIEAQYTDRIFEMFKRLHSEKDYPGTGIGLAYCKKLVELVGGKIWVKSVPGEGSTFFFTYPREFRGGGG